MTQDLETAFNLLSLDARVKCIVLTGYGKRVCAGADLEAGLSYENDTALTHRDGGGRVALAVHRCTKPTISAINRQLSYGRRHYYDPPHIHPHRLLHRKNRLRIRPPRHNNGSLLILFPPSSYRSLPRHARHHHRFHLPLHIIILLSTLFSEILPPGQVIPRALELASDVAKNASAVSTAVMRDLMWRVPGTAEETHLLDSKILLELFRKGDKEGIQSFIEKRDPEFKDNMQENAPSVWPWWKPVDTDPPPTAEELMQRLKGKVSGVGKAKI
ncbi:hypothetical protein EYC80_003692 [Monilinia laxa]|uniref:Uncharacterized protein n=1 Tax=Monilinia laxa TaxID=61186 RepID=A0A5N6KKF8_MONLA|nr:hypothetical protein EYC80_003692 [Monilinia laxa]